MIYGCHKKISESCRNINGHEEVDNIIEAAVYELPKALEAVLSSSEDRPIMQLAFSFFLRAASGLFVILQIFNSDFD